MEGTQLVQRGNIEVLVRELLEKERSVVDDLNEVLPHLANKEGLGKTRASLERKHQESLQHIAALEGGFLPIAGGWFTRLDSKSKWDRQRIAHSLETMPEEVKEARGRAEESGIFTSFSVSRGEDADPMLVGNAGRKRFLIAAWVNFEGGYSLGFRVK